MRRYSRGDFQRLAAACGFELRKSRYFMFFLSPLLALSRLRRPKIEQMTPAEIRNLLDRTHRVPSAPVNQALRIIFSAETPLGLRAPFPFGTSVLGVFQKPQRP